MKLSTYQLKIIAALKAGYKLHYLSGMNAHYWIGHVKPRPSFNTVTALKHAGLLRLVKEDWRGATWEWSGKP